MPSKSSQPPPIKEVLTVLKDIQKNIEDIKKDIFLLKDDLKNIPTEITMIDGTKKGWFW